MGVEYAATDGWRTATLHVGDAALLASRTDPKVRSQLASQWRGRLIHAKRRTDAQEDRHAEASALGRAWADEKANTLRDQVPAAEWPDFWDEASNGPLPIDIEGKELGEMLVSATRAAHDRWAELLNEQRLRNSATDGERSVTSKEDVAMVLEEWTEQRDA